MKLTELKKEFEEKFVIFNKSSNSNRWWRVPYKHEDEIASPVEVWSWIEKAIHTREDEIVEMLEKKKQWTTDDKADPFFSEPRAHNRALEDAIKIVREK